MNINKKLLLIVPLTLVLIAAYVVLPKNSTVATSNSVITSSKNVPPAPISTKTALDNSSYTLSQVAQHSSATDCWMAINGKVYDVTSFVPNHPNNQIVAGCGMDATAMFEQVGSHMGKASRLLSKYEIGTLTK